MTDELYPKSDVSIDGTAHSASDTLRTFTDEFIQTHPLPTYGNIVMQMTDRNNEFVQAAQQAGHLQVRQ